MHKCTDPFVQYCKRQLNLDEENGFYKYKSLPVCIIDCVYSLRANYNRVTLPIVERYASHYMAGDKYLAGDTVSMLLKHIEEMGGARAFADKVIQNHQTLGRERIPKENVCCQLAEYLHYLRIDTLEDFQKFPSPGLLESVVRSVKGMGDAGTSYLFMLAGDRERCKADVHILRFVQEACGCGVSPEECQQIFTEAVGCLKGQHPGLTVRGLDGIIWNRQQPKK